MKKIVILSIFGLLFSVSIFPQKRFITVAGKKICINTIGTENRMEGQPVVVFESGYGTPMGHWDRVLDGVSEMAPLVTYDRPGIGDSEPDDEMPTIKNVADKLIKILHQLDIEPPYILVGHSLGGAYVRGFAVYYPEMLAGLVIIDPADFTETQLNKREVYRDLGFDEAAIDSLFAKWEKANMENRKNSTAPLSVQEEGEVLEELRNTDFKEINDSVLPNIPVHILTGGRYDTPERFRSTEFNDSLEFRIKMKYRVERWTDVIQSVDKGMLLYSGDAGHFVHWDEPELLICSIRIILQDYEHLKQ
jgi:pimeloyl-ACP methyl ester carboxylesterase